MEKRLIFILATAGFLLPIAVLIVDWLVRGWFPGWIPYVWPTSLLLFPYAGFQIDLEKIAVILFSACLNAGLYAIVGFVILRGLKRLVPPTQGLKKVPGSN